MNYMYKLETILLQSKYIIDTCYKNYKNAVHCNGN